MLKRGPYPLSRATMPIGEFAAAVGLTPGRATQMKSAGAIVGHKVGKGFFVDVPATIERAGRPDWVWSPEEAVEALEAMERPANGAPEVSAREADAWLVVRGVRVPLSVPAASAMAIADAMTPGCSLGGLTKGQFSLLDLLRAVLGRTGPADVTIAAWTTGIRDAEVAAWLLQSGAIRSLTWVLDSSFVARQPEYAAIVMERFGADAIRTAETHAKFLLITNAEWQIVVRSSMNLNRNARWEQYDLDDSPALAEHYARLVAELMATAAKGYGDKREGTRALQASLGGDNAPPDVYSYSESAEKLGARNVVLPAVAAMVARETGNEAAGSREVRAAQAGDYYTARARLEIAKAAIAEVRLSEARRELLPALAVRDYCGQIGGVVRERMLAVEMAAASQMDAVAQVWLAGELRRALSDCADALDRATVRLLLDADVEAIAAAAMGNDEG